MPTYEFRCPAGHDFERFHGRMSDAPTQAECPECGALAERRISGGAGFVFKGSGFYITDYGKDGKKDQQTAARARSDAADGGGSATGGDAAKDAKSGGDAGAKGGGDAGGKSDTTAPAAKPAGDGGNSSNAKSGDGVAKPKPSGGE